MNEVDAGIPDERQSAISEQMEADGSERTSSGHPVSRPAGENGHHDDGDDGDVVEAGEFPDQLPHTLRRVLQQRGNQE